MHELFALHAASIESALACVCRSVHLASDQADDFAQDVRLHLLQRPRVLESFRGQCQVQTYLFRVISNLLVNWQAKRFGRWRPSRQSQRMGPAAIALEKLIDRDGFEPADAIEQLAACRVASRAKLSEIAKTLRRRMRLRGFDLKTLANNPQVHLATCESAHDAAFVESWMVAALVRLNSDERELLHTRFCAPHCAKPAAVRFGMTVKQYYARVERILARLRCEAVRVGIDEELTESLIDCRALAELRLMDSEGEPPVHRARHDVVTV